MFKMPDFECVAHAGAIVSERGLGMKVAVIPRLRATPFTPFVDLNVIGHARKCGEAHVNLALSSVATS
jgi:hypothetical protein